MNKSKPGRTWPNKSGSDIPVFKQTWNKVRRVTLWEKYVMVAFMRT